MKRLITAIVVAIEAVGVLAAGLGVTLVPLTLMWMIDYELGFPFSITLGLATSAWMLAHLVPVGVTVSADAMGSLGLGTEPLTFLISLAPLGITLITVVCGVALGRRAARSSTPILGVVTALLVFGVGSWLLGSQAATAVVTVSAPGYVLLPALVYGLGMLGGFVAASVSSETRLVDRISRAIGSGAAWLQGPAARSLYVAVRVGGGVAIGIVAVAALLFTVVLVVNYGSIIALSQGLHVTLPGTLALALGQAALLPNAIIWTASWLVGPGFTVGVGTAVSPVATHVGPLPAFPLLGALPEGTHSWGLVGLAVPILLGFALSYRLFTRTREPWGDRVPAWLLPLCAIVTGGVAGGLLGGAAWLSAGAIGPDRLQEVGPNGWAVCVWTAVVVATASLIGLVVAAVSKQAVRADISLSGERIASGLSAVSRAVISREPKATAGDLDETIDLSAATEAVSAGLADTSDTVIVPDAVADAAISPATQVTDESTSTHTRPRGRASGWFARAKDSLWGVTEERYVRADAESGGSSRPVAAPNAAASPPTDEEARERQRRDQDAETGGIPRYGQTEELNIDDVIDDYRWPERE